MSGIPWQRRVEYACGYLQLGMLPDAAAELSLIDGDDRHRPEVLSVRCDLYSETKDWPAMIEAGRALAEVKPDHPHGWISWAFALREVQQIAEARGILLQAEPLHPACGVLHYNLACYACLLGDEAEAVDRLRRAIEIDAVWKESALEDSDLARMRERLRSL